MTRVKRGVTHTKRRKNILKHTKGYRWGRKSKIKLAKVAKMKAGQYAYNSRKTRKRANRGLWQLRIGAAAKALDTSYSALMGALKQNKIEINRKVLSELAANEPKIFETLVKTVNK